MQRRRVYLDHAATSWPKSPAAIEAAEKFIRDCGATSGRGAYTSAREADRILADARVGIARFIDADSSDDIAFCTSGTHSLNAALHGWLKPGDRVITTAIEHNSVLRPLEHLKHSSAIEIVAVDCDADGVADVDAALQAAQQPAAAVIVNHASNVTGAVQNLDQWRSVADACGGLLMVDGSQSLGHIPLSMKKQRVDVLASAGHKGLGGLAGSGILAASKTLRERLQPLMLGGTGVASEEVDYTPVWPHSVEVGNLNLPAIASLAASVAGLHPDAQASRSRQHELAGQLLGSIAPLLEGEQAQLHGHRDVNLKYVPIVSLTFRDWDIHDVASILDAQFGIEVRAGLHCAAKIHDCIGTRRTGGTLRISFGHETTAADVELLSQALHAILSM